MTLLGANLIWTTLCLGGYRAETMVVTTALAGTLVALHLLACGYESPSRPRSRAALWLLPFLGYVVLNVAWVSPVPWLGWRDAWNWALMFATFSVVLTGIRSAAPRRVLVGVLVGLGLIAVAMGCYQRFVAPGWLMLGRHQVDQFLQRASGPFGIPNSLAAFLLLVLPAAGVRACRGAASAVQRVLWGWITAVLALGLVLTLSRGAWIGLGLACVIWPLAISRWSWARRFGLAGAVVVGWSLVGTVVYQASPGARDRVGQLMTQGGELSRPVLWRAGWQLFVERPLTGTGGGSYNLLFERHRPKGFIDDPQWAHNDYLNTLSDYGLIGFGLLFGVAGALAWRGWRDADRDGPQLRAGRDSPGVEGGLGVGVLAFAIHLSVDFHWKIPALALAFATCAALAMPPSPRERIAGAVRPGRRWARFLAWSGVVGTAVIVGFVLRMQQAEALRSEAREALERQARGRNDASAAGIRAAGDTLQRAVALDPNNGQAWSDLAFARSLQTFAEPQRGREWGGMAEVAARRAIALAEVVPEFWIRLGVALDLRGRSDGARAAFERARDLAPNHPHVWYYYAYHLSRDTKQREAALRAVAICLSLDPGNTEAEALRAKLNVRP